MFKRNNEDHWIPLADLMTGLMIIFLLIAVILIGQMKRQVVLNQQKIIHPKNTIDNQISLKRDLYQDLNSQFKNNLKQWNASLNKDDLSIQFLGPQVLFRAGSSELKPEFKQILSNFFPRYLSIISKPKYLHALKNIEIEGYSSAFWHGVDDVNKAYFLNMQLSESRALETFRYLSSLDVGNNNISLDSYQDFLRTYVIVSGFSSSHPVKGKGGSTNNDLSQRVEFRVIF